MIGPGPPYWSKARCTLKDVVDRFQLTNGRLLGITTDNASSHNSMISKLQLTLWGCAMKLLELRNNIQ